MPFENWFMTHPPKASSLSVPSYAFVLLGILMIISSALLLYDASNTSSSSKVKPQTAAKPADQFAQPITRNDVRQWEAYLAIGFAVGGFLSCGTGGLQLRVFSIERRKMSSTGLDEIGDSFESILNGILTLADTAEDLQAKVQIAKAELAEARRGQDEVDEFMKLSKPQRDAIAGQLNRGAVTLAIAGAILAIVLFVLSQFVLH